MSYRLVLITLLAVVVASSLMMAAPSKSGVIGSPHDVGGQGCKSCHAPHNGSQANGLGDQSTGKTLLWSQKLSNITFGTYDSPSMQNKTTEIGGIPLANTENRMYSLLCMSCHDGVTTPTVIGPTDDHAVGNVANSFGLTNDHPVNMNHDPSKNAGLATVANVTAAGLVFFGASNTVQCASCHDPHNNNPAPFLRKSNTASALCLTCHL